MIFQDNATTPRKCVAIMQPYFFPYVGYFQLINAVDVFVIYDDVNFIKRGWINRNNLLINGQVNLFTIPLAKASQNDLINEVRLNDFKEWSDKFLKTIEQSYRKAPHFEAVYGLLGQLFEKKIYDSMANLALESLKATCNYLEIKTKIIETSALYNNKNLKGQDRILDTCLQEKATHYINPTGGQELYSKELFADNKICLNFIQSRRVEYPQFKNEFVPWLSIIDVLMFNSVTSVQHLLTEFDLL
jgi:WbqC-like protein family